jgi:hypothetical protein
MSGRTLFEDRSPKTQSIEAVKALLAWRGRERDPLPTDVSLDNGRMVLVLSNKKDVYYVTTPEACSCPSATYHPGQACKHQRKYFPQPVRTLNLAEEIKPAGKWPGGMNGPVNLQAVV